jgi:hypothetical protein
VRSTLTRKWRGETQLQQKKPIAQQKLTQQCNGLGLAQIV